MLFNSWLFLVVFLPVVLAVGLGLLHGTPRIIFLIGAGFVFYAAAGLFHALVLAVSILWVHFFIGRSDVQPTVLRTVVAGALPIGVLVYFKYLGFLIDGVVRPLGLDFIAVPVTDDRTLPAGVSFFTFQLMSYAIDRMRGEVVKPLKLPQFALLIGFFPHLVAGPILRYRDIAAGLMRMGEWRLRIVEAPTSVTYIVMGLAFKVLIADRIAAIVDPMVKQLPLLSIADALFVVLGYSYQIYFDFYGYSLIAIGLGLLFGLNFPANFDRPYCAKSPREFWRRWHITLSFWIRDYVYLPLGGNRHYVRNILITFALFGLWHGAGWNYVVWGLYHAVLVIGYHAIRSRWDRMPGVLQVAITFSLVSLGWLLFLFDFSGFAAFWRQVAHPVPLASGMTDASNWVLVGIAAAVAYFVRVEVMARSAVSSTAAALRLGIGLGIVTFAVMLFLDKSAVFIYFRF